MMVLEVARVVGIFNCLTRMADGLGLRLDPETTEAGERRTKLTDLADGA